MKRPNGMRHLDDAIRRLCGGAPQDFVRARTVMARGEHAPRRGRQGRKRTGGAGPGKTRSRNGACLLLLSCHAIKTP